MKKFFSLLLLIIYCFTLFSINTFAEDEEIDIGIINELKDIGIVDNDGVYLKNSTDAITRAEFSKIICDLINIDASGTSYKSIFKDVTPDTKYYEEIITLCNLNYMSGYGDDLFMPDREITGTEAIKVIVNLCGYKYKALSQGGYPGGYELTALQLGLSKNVKAYFDRGITYKNAIRLIYNSLDVPLAKLNSVGKDSKYTINEDDTILSEYFKMKKDKGLVTANDLVGIKNNKIAPKDKISIDSVIYTPKSLEDLNLIGLKVEFIYKIDVQEDYKQIVSIRKQENIDELTVNAVDFAGQNGNEFKYYFNDDIRTIKFSKTADIIYNNERGEFTEDMFDNINIGSIKFINSESKGYDLVIINDFNTMCVGRIDKLNKVVIDTDNPQKELSLEDYNKTVKIFDDKNNYVNFQFISPFDILTYAENDNNVLVYVSSSFKSGEITEVIDESEYKKIKINDEIITLNREATLKYNNLRAGDLVKCSLDYYGNAAYITMLSKDGLEYIFLAKLGAERTGIDETLVGKFYSTARGITSFKFASNLLVNGRMEKNITLSRFKELLGNNVEQLLGIKLNENNEIVSVEISKDLSTLLAENSDGFCRTHILTEREYFDDPPTFDRSIIVSASTQLMVIPSDVDSAQDKEYKTITVSYLTERAKYLMEAYNSKKEYQIPDTVVIRMDSGSSSAPAIKLETATVVVKSIVNTITEEGLTVKKVNIQKGSNEDYFYIDENDKPVATVHAGKPNQRTFTLDELEIGDIIRFSKDATGFIRIFEAYYDYSEDEWLNDAEITRAGMIRSEIAFRSGDFFFIPHWYLTSDLYGGFDLKEKTLQIGGITVIENRDGRDPYIRAGAMSELEKGDKVIVHIAYAQLIGIIIFK